MNDCVGVPLHACEVRAGVVGGLGLGLANALCVIWCGSVLCFQWDWLWTSSGGQ